MGSSKRNPSAKSQIERGQKFALFLGDNQKGIASIDDDSVDAVIIDPNYGINSKKVGLAEWLETLLLNDDYIRGGTGFNGNDWDSEIPKLTHFEQLFRVLKPGGFIACFANARRDHYVKMTIERVGFEIKEPLLWIRTSGTFARAAKNQKKYGGSNLRIIHEPIIIAQKPISKKTSIVENFKKYGTGLFNINEVLAPNQLPTTNLVYDNHPDIIAKLKTAANSGFLLPTDSLYFVQKPTNEKEYGLELVNEHAKRLSVMSKKITKGANKHDTVKPIELMRFLVKLLSFKGSVVLDSYMGSGTTALACVLEDRRFIGMEMNPDYFYISKVKIHTTFFNEVVSKRHRIKKVDLLWHLEGLREIKSIASQSKVSKETLLKTQKMIAEIRMRLKKGL